MGIFRKWKINALVTAILYVLVGLVFVIFPEIVLEYVPLALAVLLALFGLVYIIDYFRTWDIEYKSNGLAIGILLLFTALFLFLQKEIIVAAIPLLLGFAVIVSGAIKLQNAIVLNRSRDRMWIPVLVLALVCLLLGALFIVNPFASSHVLVIVIGVGLLISGISDLVIILLMKRRVGQAKKVVKQAVEQQTPAPAEEKPEETQA